MRNPYYERLLVRIGQKYEQKYGNSPMVYIRECPNIKKIKGSPAVFEIGNNTPPFEWAVAIYIYEELETKDSRKFDVISGIIDSGPLIDLVNAWLQSVIDDHVFEKRKDDKGTRVQDS